jgi:hypothetical protein
LCQVVLGDLQDEILSDIPQASAVMPHRLSTR